MRRKRVSGATQEPLPRIKIPTFVGLLAVIIGFIASVLLVNVPALESAVASRPDAPLDAVLLQSSLDDVSAIVSPTVGLGGTTTLMATDFVTVEGRLGAQFVGAGKVVSFPAAVGSVQNIELDRGEVEFWYRPNYDAGASDDTNHALIVVDDLDAFVGNEGPNEVWLNGPGHDPLSCVCAVEWLSSHESLLWVAPNPALRAYSFLRQAAIDLNLFYRLRDELLSGTPDGRGYIDLYYTHDREILGLLVADSALRDKGAAVLDLWQPHLQALMDDQGDSATITAAQVQAMDDFLTNLSAVGSIGLQQDITAERARLGDLDDFVGPTMEEARGDLIGYTVYPS